MPQKVASLRQNSLFDTPDWWVMYQRPAWRIQYHMLFGSSTGCLLLCFFFLIVSAGNPFFPDSLFLACATQHKFCNGMQKLNTTNRPFWISKTICIYESLFASLNLFAIVCISPRFVKSTFTSSVSVSAARSLGANAPLHSTGKTGHKCDVLEWRSAV